MTQPLNVHVSRGGIVESTHPVHAVVVDSSGSVLKQWGDIKSPVYPRSSIKAMQMLAMMELDGAEKFNFTGEELAACCASHNGEHKHTSTVQSMLNKIGLQESDFECGVHWPMRAQTGYELAGNGLAPNQLHNNCSGKHAGMLALAKLLNADPTGYIHLDHPVQKLIAKTMAEMCEFDYSSAASSPDGCSAPTWAIPLYNLALAFSKLADPSGLSDERAQACHKIYDAAVSHPFLVAGTERYCTDMMSLLGKRVFLKTGAEGVYVAAIPELKLAIALKCSDGATRAAESAMTCLLEIVGVTDKLDSSILNSYRAVPLSNWNGLSTGDITCQA